MMLFNDAFLPQTFSKMHMKVSSAKCYPFCSGLNELTFAILDYRKISNIRRTQNQNLNDSRLIMQLPLPNPFKPGVKSRMKM